MVATLKQQDAAHDQHRTTDQQPMTAIEFFEREFVGLIYDFHELVEEQGRTIANLASRLDIAEAQLQARESAVRS